MAQKKAPASMLVPINFIIPEPYRGAGAIAVLPDASFRMIIRCAALNFDMKSVNEKIGIVGGFADLVDSLEADFPIQICLHPKQLDTEAYARQYDTTVNNEKVPAKLRFLAQAHVQHWEQTVKLQNLLRREFYIVVPFKGNLGPISEGLTDQLPFASIFKVLFANVEKKVGRRDPKASEIEQARMQMEIRAETIEDGLTGIGIETFKRLDEDEIIDLLRECFHPALAERQRTPRQTHAQAFASEPEQNPSGRRRIPRELEGPRESPFGPAGL